jgi:hypothetical protein
MPRVGFESMYDPSALHSAASVIGHINNMYKSESFSLCNILHYRFLCPSYVQTLFEHFVLEQEATFQGIQTTPRPWGKNPINLLLHMTLGLSRFPPPAYFSIFPSNRAEILFRGTLVVKILVFWVLITFNVLGG